MKTIVLMLAFTIFAGIVTAQSLASNEVPQAVRTSYLSQHSTGAGDSVWAKKVETIYAVHFQDDGKYFEAQYAADGSWIKTFAEASREEVLINSPVGCKINELYPDHQVVKTYVELDNDGKFYVVDLKKEESLMKVYFTMSGNIYK